jgi:hypothetical protein
MLSIIAGDPTTAVARCTGWSQAERLYRMMQKDQLDRQQPWFTKICCAWVVEDPVRALVVACTHAVFDEELAVAAITNGLGAKTSEELVNPTYFSRDKIEHSPSFRNAFLLLPSNTTIRLHLELGFKGSLAYNRTIVQLSAGIPDWRALARRFVEVVREIEGERGVERCL